MPFVVVYDSCVLFPSATRDLLLRVAGSTLVQAKFTESILDEVFTALHRRYPDIEGAKATRLRDLIVRAVPDCLVGEYERFIDAFELPDPQDRHVAAAAVVCGAQLIITSNLKDFPDSSLPSGLKAKHPDDFLVDLLDLPHRGQMVHAAVSAIAADWNATVGDVCDRLRADGLILAARRLTR